MTAGENAWRPTATREALEHRARLNAQLRQRFAEQGVLEVDTPILSGSSCLDPQVPSYCLDTGSGPRWLQTSPENHMKRLLAAGSGAIYRLGPVFRAEEQGRWHSPEFTLLEWYRPGFSDQELMADVAGLVAALGGPERWVQQRYADLIHRATGLDIFSCSDSALRQWCVSQGLRADPAMDRDVMLDYIMGVHVGPEMGRTQLEFVTHFPASQAALARLDPADRRVARRFELYWQGVELANGFYELSDATEQRARFESEVAERQRQGLSAIPVDEHLLAALEHGMPDVSGVALGIDRLYALLLGAPAIAPVQSFCWDNA